MDFKIEKATPEIKARARQKSKYSAFIKAFLNLKPGEVISVPSQHKIDGERFRNMMFSYITKNKIKDFKLNGSYKPTEKKYYFWKG
jgi:hypothetical protein